MNKITDYKPFISSRAARRKPSAIRELQPLVRLPGMISLGGGMPNPGLFPFEKLNFTLKGGSNVEISGEKLEKALQYSPSYGIPEFIEWIKNYQQEEHRLKENEIPEWEVCVTNGSQDGLAKTFDLLINEGDYVITENPTYSGAIASFQPLGCNLVGIDVDKDGMIPSELERILSSWPSSSPKPRVVYTIPIGQNPSGATLTLDRKKRIYELASKFNLIIIEDDPYYNLQLPTTGNPVVKPIPSFLSLDKEGRVIRLDSLSKIISSGLRIGWVTGPKTLVDLIQIDQQATCLHASGLGQMVVHTLLQSWGKQGWETQKDNVQKAYTERRDLLLQYADKHLSGLAEWFAPSAGMFIWFKLLGIEDSNNLIKTKAVNEKVLLVPGKSFTPSDKPSPYVRASYSTATPNEMEEAMKRLATLLKKEREQNS